MLLGLLVGVSISLLSMSSSRGFKLLTDEEKIVEEFGGSGFGVAVEMWTRVHFFIAVEGHVFCICGLFG